MNRGVRESCRESSVSRAWEEGEWRSSVSGFSTSTSVVDAAADVFGWLRRGNDLLGLAFESEIVEPSRTRATSLASIDAAGKLAAWWRGGAVMQKACGGRLKSWWFGGERRIGFCHRKRRSFNFQEGFSLSGNWAGCFYSAHPRFQPSHPSHFMFWICSCLYNALLWSVHVPTSFYFLHLCFTLHTLPAYFMHLPHVIVLHPYLCLLFLGLLLCLLCAPY